MQEKTDSIRQNQNSLIEMQKKKIDKLKRMMDVSSITPPMLASNRKIAQRRSGANSHRQSRDSSVAKLRTSQPNRDSTNKGSAGRRQMTGLDRAKSGSKSPTMHTSSFLRNRSNVSRQSRDSPGRLSSEYQQFVQRRESQMSQQLDRVRQDRTNDSRNKFNSTQERLAQRTYSHEDYQETGRESLQSSDQSSPCRACQYEGQRVDHHHDDSQFDMKPVRDSSHHHRKNSSRKYLEPQQTYTLINQEHLSTMEERRQEELRARNNIVLVHDNYEPVSPLPEIIQREIQPQPLIQNDVNEGINSSELYSYMRK